MPLRRSPSNDSPAGGPPGARRRTVTRRLILAVVLGIASLGPSALPAAADYAAERAEMGRVNEQDARQPDSARPGGRMAPEVLGAMGTVPRYEFFPDRVKGDAYADRPLP